MRNVILVIIGLAALGFLLAGISALTGSGIMGVSPEGFSRGCTNLSLIAIALNLWFKEGSKGT
ncbi:MAG: hypothetical protein JRH18_04250 [Deltaproteobacteria bacterium]|nr:hypothetical protein [Deltaproteobacteria bacterium]MBW1996007.1 hypothetical protein [Deltaproteobacteria bacterium]MBW2150858.1 hypothetical protein [Deltaproteobacteria bacterium]